MKKVITKFGGEPQITYGKFVDCMIIIGMSILSLIVVGIIVGIPLWFIGYITHNLTTGWLITIPFLYLAYKINKRILKKLHQKLFEI